MGMISCLKTDEQFQSAKELRLLRSPWPSTAAGNNVAVSKLANQQQQWSAMDKKIALLDIPHYRQKLATEQDETKRQILLRLLAEEQAKLTC